MAPTQEFAKGVTVIVAVTGLEPLLMALKDAMLLFPLELNPIAAFEFVQLKIVPATEPLKVIADTAFPLQTVWLNTEETFGVGFTLNVNVFAVPEQPKTGVTVIVAVTGLDVKFSPVKLAMLPVPLEANPIEVVEFVQLNTVPPTVPEKFIPEIAAPLQTV